jgi:hypothetical protein
VSGLSTRVRTLGPVATEMHASVFALLGALLLASDTIRLAEIGWPWSVFAAPLGFGAGLGLVAAVLPWIWPALPLGGHRALIWSGWSIATLTAILALIPLDYGALLGAQFLLFAAVLPEMSGRPASLRWFWIALILTVAMMLIYREVADVRPVAG